MHAGEAVSRQCPVAEASHSYSPTTSLPRQAPFPQRDGESLNDARTPLADIFSMLPGGAIT